MIPYKEQSNFCIKYILVALYLVLCFPNKGLGQQLHAYKNLAPEGYHFWFYSPEPPPTTLVPLLPDDIELRKRMQLEQLFHAKPVEWKHWKEREEAKRTEKLKPLVIFLHGASLCGHNLKQVLSYGTLDAMDRGLEVDAYVLAPQNPGGAWDPDKLMKLTEWASRTHPGIDTTRIYVLGMSLGGYGALDLPAAYPHRIAASMSICGGATSKTIGNLNQVPLWILHGTADVAVPVNCSDRVVAAMRRDSIPQRLIYSRLKGYNHSQPCRLFYMYETYDWLFSHRLTDVGRPLNKEIYIGPRNIPEAYRRMGRRGQLKPSGNREVYGHGHLEAIEFAIMQDSIARADSIAQTRMAVPKATPRLTNKK